MVSLSRRYLDPMDAKAFVELLRRHRAELSAYHMQLQLRSPARAAIGTLLDQQAEIAAIITGDRDVFKGKAHSAKL